MPGSERKLGALSTALGLWAAWTFATWWFEGRLDTFARPDAVFDRLVYTGVANIGVGVIGSALALRHLLGRGVLSTERAGFGKSRRTAIWVPIAVVLGLGLYFGQGAPSTNVTVLLNAHAQVLVVSVAEVLVCWAVVGGTLARIIGGPGLVSVPIAAVVAGIAFGVYHFAHSAPFNSFEMVGLLTIVGLVTGVFFFVSRDVYATIVFHNFLGVFGVVQALAARKALETFETPQVPLLATAATAVIVLILVDVVVVSRSRSA